MSGGRPGVHDPDDALLAIVRQAHRLCGRARHGDRHMRARGGLIVASGVPPDRAELGFGARAILLGRLNGCRALRTIGLGLESQILRDSTNWRDPATRIEQILTDLLEKNILKPRDFAPSYYAAFIARFAIGDNDWNTALRVLRLGLAFSNSDEQLLYLTRVLDQIVPPDLLEKLKKEDPKKNVIDP